MMRTLFALVLTLAAGPLAAQEPVTMRSGLSWPGRASTTIMAGPTVNGVARFTQSADNVVIGPVTVVGAYRAVETGKGVEVRNSKIVGLVGRDLQRDGIRLRSATDVEISGFDLSMREEPQSGSHLPEGIAVYAGERIVIRNGRVSGFRMAVEDDPKTGKKRYTNGDGISAERASSGTITNVTSSNNSDGGFDLKGNWNLDNLTAIGNGKSYRAWNTVEAGTLTSVDAPLAVHLAKGAVMTIDKLVARSNRAGVVIALEGKASITIAACDLTGMPAGSKLVQHNDPGNTVTLGPSCRLP